MYIIPLYVIFIYKSITSVFNIKLIYHLVNMLLYYIFSYILKLAPHKLSLLSVKFKVLGTDHMFSLVINEKCVALFGESEKRLRPLTMGPEKHLRANNISVLGI